MQSYLINKINLLSIVQTNIQNLVQNNAKYSRVFQKHLE